MEPRASSADAAAVEADLLARVAAGDRAAFRNLYDQYGSALLGLAVRMVGDAGEAEELLQDAFLKIWRHAAAYDSRLALPFTWAVTLMRRTCIDHLRRRNRRPALVPLPEEDCLGRTDEAAVSPMAAAVASDDTHRVMRALAELPGPQRQALELALFSELTHAEIALRLQQPVGSVKSWIRRGLLELRATLIQSAP